MIFSRNKLLLSIKFDTSIKQLLIIYLLLDNNTNKIEKKAENLDTLYLKSDVKKRQLNIAFSWAVFIEKNMVYFPCKN